MTMKQDVLDLLDRCLAVVEGECGLLTDWAAVASTARAARCRARRRRICGGASTPVGRARKQIRDVENDQPSPVSSRPTSLHKVFVKLTERTLAEREKLDVNALTNPQFTLALRMAERNAKDAASNAELIVADCTG
jgi:hypothetical protein